MKKLLKKLFRDVGYEIVDNKTYLKMRSKVCFSQYGEDHIILTYLGLNKIENATYMDIGANHPFELNNTALLYENGLRGINIEPDPDVFKILEKYRTDDINLNIGIHKDQGELIFYQFEDSIFNTFSEEESSKIQNKGVRLIDRKTIKVDTYNNVIERYLNHTPPTILFLDAEGLDEIIIDSINFKKYAPKIICVETFAYGIGIKNMNLINKVKDIGYDLYADTFVNTILTRNA